MSPRFLSARRLAMAVIVLSAATRPAGARSPADIESLIRHLGHPHPAVRDSAERELTKLGAQAWDVLTGALQDPDPDVASRARYLLGTMGIALARGDDAKPIRELLEAYQKSPDRLGPLVLEELDQRFHREGLSVLCRLVRYETSPRRSKLAALFILFHHPPDRETWDRQRSEVQAALAESRQVAARWLRSAAAGDLVPDKSGTMARQFVAFAQAERETLATFPQRTDAPIIAALELLAARYCHDAGKDDEARGPLERATALMRQDPATRHAIVSRFGDRLPFAWIDQAFAEVLRDRKSTVGFRSEETFRLYLTYSELLHDQGRHLEAAECRKQIADFAEEQFGFDGARRFRARELCFRAHHAMDEGKPDDAVPLLEKALEADPTDADVLIALFRLSEGKSDQRARVSERIARALTDYRRKIQAEPDNHHYCNYFAWLVANTQGDLAEATRMSERSLELSPNSGALLDTLAHCHFAAGNYALAVQFQRKAARVEPYSRMIASELAVFEEKLSQEEKASRSPQG